MPLNQNLAATSIIGAVHGESIGAFEVTLSPAAAGPSAYWYLTRSSGVVALVLLTLATVLGVIDVSRWRHPLWPRFVLDSLHRNVSMLAMAFVGVHVLTSVLDSFAPISLADAVLPFVGSYRPFWLGLGAVAFDMLLAVLITSLLRRRIGRHGEDSRAIPAFGHDRNPSLWY